MRGTPVRQARLVTEPLVAREARKVLDGVVRALGDEVVAEVGKAVCEAEVQRRLPVVVLRVQPPPAAQQRLDD